MFEEKKEDRKPVDEVEEDTTPLYLNEFVGQLFNNSKLSDCVFVVDDERIPAHKLILAASSPVFEAMLYPLMLPDESDPPASPDPVEIRVKDTSPSVFRAMLECIYSDSVVVDSTNIKGLIALAKKYQIEKLQVLCADFMEGDVNIKNACEMFQIAPELLGDEEFGMSFLAEHAAEIIRTPAFLNLGASRMKVFLKSDKLAVEEVPLFLAVQSWGRAECKRQNLPDSSDNMRQVLADLLPHVRFPTMALSEIASFVSSSGLLSQEDMLKLFTYMSLQTDEEKAFMETPWNATPREGGFNVKGSTLLKDKKYAKAVQILFGPDGKKAAKKLQLKLLYKSSKDGFTAQAFHVQCNGKGATLTVIQAINGYLFGGYHAGDWSEGNYSQADAWLFNIKGPQGDGKPAKFLFSSGNKAYCTQGYGPSWGGGHDLHVNTNMQSSSNYASPNSFRTVAPGYSAQYDNNSLAGGYNFTVQEMEVFQVVKS